VKQREQFATGIGAAQIHHFLVHVVQVLLLWTQNRSWSGDADPSDKGGGRETEVLHAVEANQRACAAQASFAVHSDGPGFVFGGCEELGHDLVGRSRPINEKQIEVLDALLRELRLLVLRLVEAHDQRDAHAPEDWNVIIGRERAVAVRDVERAGEGDELARHNPVQIAVFHFLIRLVLSHVEGGVVVPAEGDGVLEALEAVQVGAAVRAVAHRGVAVGNELVVVGAERVPGLVGRLFETDYHEGAHEERRVALLGVVKRSVVVNFIVLVLLVIHQFLQLLAEQVHFAQVERAEVGEKRLVDQIVVDAEVERVLSRLRRVLVADPIETPRNNLDGCVRFGVARSVSKRFVLNLNHFADRVFDRSN